MQSTPIELTAECVDQIVDIFDYIIERDDRPNYLPRIKTVAKRLNRELRTANIKAAADRMLVAYECGDADSIAAADKRFDDTVDEFLNACRAL